MKGELIINVPNGLTPSQLCLTEVLYSPKVSYTLVSIGKLDDAGFDVTFGGGKCTIHEKDGTVVGEVPKVVFTVSLTGLIACPGGLPLHAPGPMEQTSLPR